MDLRSRSHDDRRGWVENSSNFAAETEHSRHQSLEGPGAVGRFQLIDQAVVKAARPTLPKLKTLGDDAVPPPKWGERDVLAGVARIGLVEALGELLAGRERLALGRSPGTDAALPGTRAEIGLGDCRREAGNRDLHTHLVLRR